MKTIRLNILW